MGSTTSSTDITSYNDDDGGGGGSVRQHQVEKPQKQKIHTNVNIIGHTVLDANEYIKNGILFSNNIQINSMRVVRNDGCDLKLDGSYKRDRLNIVTEGGSITEITILS